MKFHVASTATRGSGASYGSLARFSAWWTAEVPTPARWTRGWWWEVGVVRNVVYALTGLSVKHAVKPAVVACLARAGLAPGARPRAARGACLLATAPLYPLVLVTYGTLLGRHALRAPRHRLLRESLPRILAAVLPFLNCGIVQKLLVPARSDAAHLLRWAPPARCRGDSGKLCLGHKVLPAQP